MKTEQKEELRKELFDSNGVLKVNEEFLLDFFISKLESKDKEIHFYQEQTRLTINATSDSIADKNKQISLLKAKLEAAEGTLREIRGHLQERDTSDAVLYNIDETLTKAGYPWQPED